MHNGETVGARDQFASRRIEALLSLARAPEPEAEDMGRSVTSSPRQRWPSKTRTSGRHIIPIAPGR